jgi:DNA repair protein RadD
MSLILRDYQQEAIDAAWDALGKGMKRPLLVEPTGSGKALILASLCKQAWEMDPTVRVVILVDSEELVSQNFQEFIGIWPEAPAGIYCAGLNRRQIGAQFLFASIASIYKKAYSIQRCDILLIDECHMIPRRSDAMYGRFIGDLETINPRLAIIGATATPFRLDSGSLHQGEDALFDGIAHETTALRLIEEGYLCPPRTWQQADIKTDGIGKRAGEFIVAQLEAAAMDETALEQTVEHIIQAGEPRQAWKIFGVSVAHCEALHARLEARGYRGGCVFGETDKTERRRNIARFDSGELRYLISNMALVKGFNVKRIDLVVLAFSTLSLVKYIQTIGRGTRPLYAPGYDLSTREGRLAAIDAGPKPYCYVLDLGANITRHGPFDDPWVADKKKGNGKGEAPVKECPECRCSCGTMSKACPACGFEFPPPERAISVVPDNKPILSQPPEWLRVSGTSYRPHQKEGAVPSMRVEYRVGLTVHKEWVCLNHHGYPRQKAESWWLRRGKAPVPKSVDEALSRTGELITPSEIRVSRKGKYDEIIGVRFDEAKAS